MDLPGPFQLVMVEQLLELIWPLVLVGLVQRPPPHAPVEEVVVKVEVVVCEVEQSSFVRLV